MTGAAFAAALERRLDLRSLAPLALAVSGGGDSMALLHLTAVWAADARRPLCVLTVDHGLSAQSAYWTGFVAETARRLGAEVGRLPWTGPKPSTGLPAAARRARHALLAEAARAAGARVILLGHTADDAAEADWMRAQGASLGRLREWGPSPAWPEGRGLMLLRPLLGATRAELRDWLAARELPWIEDPSNADPRFTRSRARAAGALARPGADPPDDRTCEALLFQAAAGAPGVLAAGRPALCGDPAADRQLATALVCAAGSTRPPTSAAVAALLSRLRGPGTVVATLAGARIDAGHDRVLIGRDPGRSGLPRASVRAGDTVVWDGRFEITVEADGDLLPVAGLARRLSAPNRERLRLAPAWVRPTLPVLTGADGALSLPGVRPLVHERYRLSLGAIAKERDLPALSPHMARTVQSPYMDRDKVFRANVE